MSKEFFYCKVTAGGPTEAAWKKFEAHWRAQQKARSALAKKVGSKRYVANPREIQAFQFDECPDGWIAHRGFVKCYYPRANTPERKALRKEMKIPEAFVSEFGKEMGCEMFFAFPSIRHMYCEKVGEQLLLVVPKMNERHKKPAWQGWKLPADCELIKVSEYHKLKEDHEDATSKRPAAKRARAQKA